MAGQLEAVDEANRIVVATVEGEHQHASHATACQVFLRGSVVRITGQTGIAHMGDGGMVLQPGGQGHGVFGVALNAQAQGFQTLQQQEAVERTDGRPPIPQALHPGPQGEGDVAVIGQAKHFANVTAEAKGIPVHQAVISRAGLAHQRELAVAPVEGAGVHDHAPQAGAVAPDPLGRTFNDHISAVVNWSQQSSTGSQGVVDD